jgi:hypothetical protein
MIEIRRSSPINLVVFAELVDTSIGEQRRRLSIPVVITPGTLFEALVEPAYSDHGPIKPSRGLRERARETGYASARLPVGRSGG